MTVSIRPLRVAVCIPSTDMVEASFMYDVASMMTWTASQRQDIELQLYLNRGSLLPQLRESLVEQAIAGRATHVLFLDADMRFPKDLLVRLLAHQLPLVAINYAIRKPPHRPVALGVLGDESTYIHTLPETTGLERCAVVGFGAMLIDVKLLNAMKRPRFLIGWSEQGQGYAGEDVYFCLEAAKAGFGPVIDHDLSKECAHTGSFEYTLDHAALVLAELIGAGKVEQPAAPAEPLIIPGA